MKKALKISTYILIVCGIVALGLCYIIIPERTKDAVDIAIKYLNTPIGIGTGTSITLGVVLFVIIKYAIKHTLEIKISSFNEKLKNKEKELNDKEQKLLLQKQEVETYLRTYKEQSDKGIEYLVEVCDTIPNAKVKAIGYRIKESKETLDKQVEEELANVKEFTDKHQKSFEERLAELEKVVGSYGEREETVND